MIFELLEKNTITITIHGAFDSATAQDFSITIQRAYLMGFRDFCVSLKSVTLIDKTGLMLLSSIVHTLKQKSCSANIIHSHFHPQHEPISHQEDNVLVARRKKQSKSTSFYSLNTFTTMEAS